MEAVPTDIKAASYGTALQRPDVIERAKLRARRLGHTMKVPGAENVVSEVAHTLSHLAARGESGAGIRPAIHPHALRCSYLKYLRIFFGRRALLVGRLAALGARRHFHHGLLGPLTLLVFILACDPPPDPRRTNFRVERDNVVAKYDEKTGRLTRLEVDTNKDGKTDTWTYAEGTRIERIEIDRDGDGTIDRWEYYGPGNAIEKVGSSARDDGTADEWAFQRADGSLERVETDSDRDGRIDKWEAFDAPSTAGGAPVLRSVALDTTKQGRPTERLLYRRDGSLERVEKLPAER